MHNYFYNTIALTILGLLFTTQANTQVVYANGEDALGGGLFRIDLATCTVCRISGINDPNDADLTLLPNGDFVNASATFIAEFDPPNPNAISVVNISAVNSAYGGILNPAGNVYIAGLQGFGEYNPATNLYTHIGNWPASFWFVGTMEIWYQGSQLYGYIGLPSNQQIVLIDIANPANSTIVGMLNSVQYISSACNVGTNVYMSNEFLIYQYDPATGNLTTVCDLTGIVIVGGLSSVPTGFPNYPCQCTTNAGTITPQGLTNYCVDETVLFVPNNNQVLDINDLLRYILFSNPSDTAGSIVATSSTASFTFAPPMQTGVTYYMAAMAGNNLNGMVDLTDPCLDFSNANALIWRPLPTVALSATNTEVCTTVGCLPITATLTGSPPFVFTYQIQVNGTVFGAPVTVNAAANTHTFVVCLPAGVPLGQAQVVVCSLTDLYCTNP